MHSFLVWRKDNLEIVRCLKIPEGTRFSLIKVMYGEPNILDRFDGKVIPWSLNTYEAKAKLQVDNQGNVTEIVLSQAQKIRAYKDDLIRRVKEYYNTVATGKDPKTGKPIYVDCVVGQQTIRMNTGELAAMRLDTYIRLIERAGQTVVPMIRDFHNVNHANVPLAAAISVSMQQAQDAFGYWQKKAEIIDAIEAATSMSDIKSINRNFGLKVE